MSINSVLFRLTFQSTNNEVPQSSAKFYSHELFERIHDRHVSLEGEDQRGVQGANLQQQIYIELNIPYGQSSAKLPVIQSFGSLRSFGSFGSLGSLGSFSQHFNIVTN